MKMRDAVATRHGATREIAESVATAPSGPVGEQKHPAEELVARGHCVFGGRIDRRTPNFAERAVVAALRVADGDNRDWPTIRAWGREIGTSLAPVQRSVS